MEVVVFRVGKRENSRCHWERILRLNGVNQLLMSEIEIWKEKTQEIAILGKHWIEHEKNSEEIPKIFDYLKYLVYEHLDN